MRDSETPEPPSTATPPHAIRTAVLAQVAREPSPTREAWRRRARRYVLTGYLISFLIFTATGGIYVGARPTAYVVAIGCGWGLVAFVVTVMARRSARNVLGRAPLRQAATIAVALAGAVATLAVGIQLWPNAASALANRSDVRCAAVGALYTLPILVGLVGAMARSTYLGRQSNVALFSTVAWLTGAFEILLRCDCAISAHLILGHLAPLFAGIAFSCVCIAAMRRRQMRG